MRKSEKNEKYKVFGDRVRNLLIGDRFYFRDENLALSNNESVGTSKCYVVNIVPYKETPSFVKVWGIFESHDGNHFLGRVIVSLDEVICVEVSDILERIASIKRLKNLVETRKPRSQTHELDLVRAKKEIDYMFNNIGRSPHGMKNVDYESSRKARTDFFISWITEEMDKLKENLDEAQRKQQEDDS